MSTSGSYLEGSWIELVISDEFTHRGAIKNQQIDYKENPKVLSFLHAHKIKSLCGLGTPHHHHHQMHNNHQMDELGGNVYFVFF